MGPNRNAVPPAPQSSLFREEQPQSPQTAAWAVAYTDGGARGNPGPAGYGVVVQTQNGQILGELSEFLGICTNNVAEYSGLVAALEYALANRLDRLRVVSDSELMVKQMLGQYKVRSPELRPLFDRARRLAAQLQAFEIEHVRRGKNKRADELANRAMDKGMPRTADRRV